jgi:hypothetical protein
LTTRNVRLDSGRYGTKYYSHLFVQYKENTSFKVSENLCLTLYYHEDVLNFWKIVIRMNGRNGMKTIAGKLVAIVQK